jgi:glycosyltransferase involved in cell wall biosynthesis
VTELDNPSIATVITTYNRSYCVARAIDSALAVLPGHRVIVVDDASQDGTADYVRKRFSAAIGNGQLKLIELKQNLGVTGAKNYGYEETGEEWVIFLDSDDTYLPHVGSAIEAVLDSSRTFPIVFFRCQNQAGKFVGQRPGEDLQLDLSEYLKHTSFGEALTAINKRLVGPSPPYVSSLRGYEGLGCCRLIHKFGPARLSAVTARIYDTSGRDRLSISVGFLQRWALIGSGHLILVREFGRTMPLPMRLSLLIKAMGYIFVGSIYRSVSSGKQ